MPKFDEIDILRVFLKVNKFPGRKQLAAELDIGEGSLRSILDILKKKRLLESNYQGHKLSKTGEKKFNEIKEYLSFKENVSLDFCTGKSALTCKLTNVKEIKSIISLRDLAVRQGADGALILKFDGNRLCFPDFEYNNKDIMHFAQEFNLKKGDLIILVWSDKDNITERAMLIIGGLLNTLIRGFLEEFKTYQKKMSRTAGY